MKKALITSALPYANGKVHLGHLAGAYLPADIYARWLRLKGCEVCFICGSDEHGVPITLTALKRGLTPQQVVDEYHALNGAAFESADIIFDIWGRTSSSDHHAASKEFFTRLYQNGYIEKRQTQQLYSEKSKMFLPDRYVEGICPLCGDPNARGDQCDKCGGTYEVIELKNPRVAIDGDGSAPVLKTTAHWFFKLECFADRLRSMIEAHSESSASPWRLNAQREASGWLKRGLQARAITRDTAYGVQIPLDDPDVENKRLYVWFDAPIGYITFTQQYFAQRGNADGWKDFWQNSDCPIYHFIGKDNIPFHAIIFPAMLMGANENLAPGEQPYQLPTQIVANEFLNFGADKFSKSRGNLIEIEWFARKYGSEALRYYLTAIAPESNDSVFTWADFMQRYNGELADVIGNFIHRVLMFTVNKLDGKAPDPGQLGAHQAFMDETQTMLSNAGALLDGLQFRNAQQTILNGARAGNVYFDAHAPWKSIKTDQAECHRLIYICLCRVAALGLALRPFLPKSSAAILKNFNIAESAAPGSASWLPEEIVKPGLQLKRPEALFKKLEEKDLLTS